MKHDAEVQDLVSLVFNGRDRPGLAGYDRYLDALHTLEGVYKAHYAEATVGLVSTFYDQYYLPAAQNITGLRIGRSAMPIAKVAASVSAASKGVLLEVMHTARD